MTEPASLLPPNATRLERATEAADAQLGTIPMVHHTLWNPWTCPAEFLTYLAWSVSVDTWSSDWPEHIKRARIASSFSIQRHKGTAKSIADVVASFGGQVQIEEWWQQTPIGTPHTFALLLTLSGQGGEEATAAFIDQVIAAVNRAKPVRSHFTFTQGLNAEGVVGLIGVARAVVATRLQLAAP
ncbi:phage tail protein I [Stenotrophomonas rhizophila]|uniref:phage tail protein I n=1 Tax=Stenotrophomonas rhizophila TaxID=216778 RepID=UPI003514A1B0